MNFLDLTHRHYSNVLSLLLLFRVYPYWRTVCSERTASYKATHRSVPSKGWIYDHKAIHVSHPNPRARLVNIQISTRFIYIVTYSSHYLEREIFYDGYCFRTEFSSKNYLKKYYPRLSIDFWDFPLNCWEKIFARL